VLGLGVATWGTAVPRVLAAEPAGRLTVRPEVTVDGDAVRVGDIAALDGTAEALAGIEVGPAPAPGEVRALAAATILGALRGNGVDLAGLRYFIPATVRVRRGAQRVDAGDVRAIIETYLRDTVGAEDGRLVLRAVEVPGALDLPRGPYTWRVTPPGRGPLIGKTRLLVEFLQDGRAVGSVFAVADVAAFEAVYFLRRPLSRGEVVSAEDLASERREVSLLPLGAITRAEDAIGKQAATALVAFVPLRHEQLQAPAVVRRGDVVTLLAESAGLRITVPGEVREDAARGGQVRVLNRSSQKEVVGRVVDGATVWVQF
jgi:flagella basal body P-ring formation protein FlgA